CDRAARARQGHQVAQGPDREPGQRLDPAPLLGRSPPHLAPLLRAEAEGEADGAPDGPAPGRGGAVARTSRLTARNSNAAPHPGPRSHLVSAISRTPEGRAVSPHRARRAG